MSPSAAKSRSHARSLGFALVVVVSAAGILVILALTADFGHHFAILALAAFLVPILAMTLWYLVRNWDWWRVRGNEGDQRYVKTWHGWVAKDKHKQRQGRPWYRNIFGSKATTTRKVPIAWTLQGAESHRTVQQRRGTNLQRMLQWLRIYQANERDVGNSTDVEMGTIPEPPTIRITEPSAADTVRSQYFLRPISIEQVDGPSDFKPVRTSHVMSGALRHSSGVEDIGDTVRRRRGSTDHSSVWQANSSETSRATVTQFIMPTHNFRTPAWADQLFSTGISQDSTTPLTSRKSSSNQAQERSKPPSKTRFTPSIQSATTERVRRVVRSSPASTPLVRSALADLRSSTQLSGTIDLDNLSSYLESSSAYGRFGSLAAGRVLPFEAREPVSAPAIVGSQSPTQQLKVRPRPLMIGLFPNIRRQSSRKRKHDELDDQPVAKTSMSTGAQDTLPEHVVVEPLRGITTHYEYIQPVAVDAPRPRTTGFEGSNSSLRSASQPGMGNAQDASDAALTLNSVSRHAKHISSTSTQSYTPKPKTPSFESLIPPKRGLPTKPSGLTNFPAPQLSPRKSTTRSSMIPSISLLETTTPTPQDPHSPLEASSTLLSLDEKGHQDELRQRLQWLDLRCTIKNRRAALPVLSKVHKPRSYETVLRKRGGLRRVGRFDRGSQLLAAAVGGGKENREEEGSECGAVRAKPEVRL